MYKENLEKVREILNVNRYYDSLNCLINWDIIDKQPPKGAPYMKDILTHITNESVMKMSTDEAKYLLDYFNNYDLDSIDDPYEKRCIRFFMRRADRMTKIPAEIQVEYQQNAMDAQRVWQEAFKNNDYESFKPYIYKVFDIKSRMAEALDPDRDPFSVLVDDMDEGVSAESVSKLFEELKPAVIELTSKIKATGKDHSMPSLHEPHDLESTKKLAFTIIKNLAYDEDYNTWTTKLHPVTVTMGPRDTRITTNFRSLCNTIFSCIHEMGHARYGCTSNDKAVYYGIWGGISGTLQESQSRFYETIVGHSREFCEGYFPIVQENLPEYRDVSPEEFYKAINCVKPGLKRLDADELTYNLHPIIRFEMEKDYFDGKLKLDDFRDAWNAKYKEYLGVEPETDTLGILQDVHWAQGFVGYFQSYTLGDICDGQLRHALLKEKPDALNRLKERDCSEINSFLYDHIHQFGQLYTLDEMMKNVTGEEITAKYYIDYLNNKYKELYDL